MAAVTAGSFFYFYPRPPRGGRLAASGVLPVAAPISIHALREEGDLVLVGVCVNRCKISIHALREEGDWFSPPILFRIRYFYPRPPRGGRRQRACGLYPQAIFLSTPSARRATFVNPNNGTRNTDFYPRPPRGGRRAVASSTPPPTNFYPRPPRGGRPRRRPHQRPAGGISIHALREEGDNQSAVHDVDFQKFLSTPSARRATGSRRSALHSYCHFYPRPPRGGRRGLWCSARWQ